MKEKVVVVEAGCFPVVVSLRWRNEQREAAFKRNQLLVSVEGGGGE